MSIAEKLTAIAENEQKVYDAGYAKGAEEGGGGTDVVRSILDRTITEYSDNEITSIGAHAFRECSKLTAVDLTLVESIGVNAFYKCSALTTVDLPLAT